MNWMRCLNCTIYRFAISLLKTFHINEEIEIDFNFYLFVSYIFLKLYVIETLLWLKDIIIKLHLYVKEYFHVKVFYVLPKAFYWLDNNKRETPRCTWRHLWRKSLVQFRRSLPSFSLTLYPSRSCMWETVDGMWRKRQGKIRVKWVETRRDGSTSPDQSVAPQQPCPTPGNRTKKWGKTD